MFLAVSTRIGRLLAMYEETRVSCEVNVDRCKVRVAGKKKKPVLLPARSDVTVQ